MIQEENTDLKVQNVVDFQDLELPETASIHKGASPGPLQTDYFNSLCSLTGFEVKTKVHSLVVSGNGVENRKIVQMPKLRSDLRKPSIRHER